MAKDSTTIGYAKALFEIARTESDLERIADELFRVARVLEKEHQLRQTLTDVAVPTEAKEKLIDDLLGEKASRHTVNIIKFVLGQGRERELVEISDELARIAEEESKREIAEVRVAVPLTDEQEARLSEALGKATGKNVSVKTVVDPGIIGGVQARVGDVVIDGSVRRKLDLLRERLNLN